MVIMKTAMLSLFVALAFSSGASAVLRPKFPRQPVPPSGQYGIVIIDESSVLPPGSKPPR
jgi:hypothetical protein